jgi:hypothetical protein
MISSLWLMLFGLWFSGLLMPYRLLLSGLMVHGLLCEQHMMLFDTTVGTFLGPPF